MKFRFICLFLALALLLSLLSGCGQTETTETGNQKIGISLPNDSDPKWADSSEVMYEQLTAAGFEVSVQFAGNSAEAQAQQIQDMIGAGIQTLIIAPVDPTALSDVLTTEESERRHISGGSSDTVEDASSLSDVRAPADDSLNIVCYDDLILNSTTVDYYVGFDGYEAGYLQACRIEDQLSLYDTDTTYTLELFFGDPNSALTSFQYEGAMEVLQVYLDSGVLTIPSGQSALEDCVSGETGSADRMSQLLKSYYNGQNLDAVLCADDDIAQSISDVLFAQYTGGVFPVITGMGCSEVSVNRLFTGLQSMTLLNDRTGMAEEAARVAAALATGTRPETEDSLDNGRVNVPASLFFPEEVYSTNVQEMLVQRGYFADNGDGTYSATADYTAGAATTVTGGETEEIAGDSSADTSAISSAENSEDSSAVSSAENSAAENSSAVSSDN
jgi:putative multiple sugar transport system substrate-binding protein